MTRASATLAPGSGIPGVILHGMPGGGKTACALKLAYTHEDTFDRLIWFKGPGTTASPSTVSPSALRPGTGAAPHWLPDVTDRIEADTSP